MNGSGTFVLSINNEEVKQYKFDNSTKTETIDFTNDTLEWLHPRFDKFSGNQSPVVKLELRDFKGDEKKFKISFSIDAMWLDTNPSTNENSPLHFSVISETDSDKGKIGNVVSRKASILNTKD